MDIYQLNFLGKLKKNQILVGFALENENEISNSKSKLKKKNLDLIVLNSLNDKGAGFGYNTNKVSVIDKHGSDSPMIDIGNQHYVATHDVKGLI